MAQGLFQKIWKELPQKNIDIHVFSAGVGAIEGLKASQEALKTLDEEGIDLSKHCSRKVTRELIEKAHFILAMTRGHKDVLIGLYPEAREKIWLFNEFAGINDRDIPDPIGLDLEYYRRVAAEIKEAVKKIAEKLNNVEKKDTAPS